MFGSIGRLKAAVEVVGRETVRVMKKNQFKKKKILETKEMLGQGGSSSVRSVKRISCLFYDTLCG